MFKCRRELCPHSSAKGISLIALILTIIVVIILAAIILGVATSTPEKAKVATFISDIAEVQQGVETKKATNYMPSSDGTFDVNKGFTKITIKKTPYSTAEDGWVVNLDNINIKSSTRGNDYSDVVENSQITFGEGAPDVYVYDAEGIVYYAPGFTDKENTLYSKVEVTYAATGEIPRVEAENPSQWTFNTTTGIISKYTGPEVDELTIPNYINGVKVNGITGTGWAQGITSASGSFKSIIISPGITTIGNYTFCCCFEVESITVPNTVTSFGQYAFCNLFALKSLTLPSSLTSIGYQCFSGWSTVESLNVASGSTSYKCIDGVIFNMSGTELVRYPPADPRTSYTIPSSVTTINDAAFLGCTNLTEIIIPNSVTTVEDYGFYCCYEVLSFQVPSSVTTMGDYVFTNSNKLNAIEVDESNSVYKDIDGVLFNKSGTILYSVPAGNARTAYTVPNGVTTINSRAMPYCNKLTNIDIPSSVTSIGSNTFNNCTSLTQILIHKATNSITGAKWGAPATTVVTWNP